MTLTVWFDLPSLYYLPQYQPVFEELQRRGHQCSLLIHDQAANKPLTDRFCQTTSLPFQRCCPQEVNHFYRQKQPDWIIFGNAHEGKEQLAPNTQTALLYHGIGIKACYYDANLTTFDVRFTEGPYRQQQLQALYPEANFVQTGFAKLDPLAPTKPKYKDAFDLKKHGLDPYKPTLLYAPTFYPSSIECMPKNWPHRLNDCNIIIKPHLFSYTHKRYKKQRKLFQLWESHTNVYLAPPESLSLLPYMATADLLISEASSALFEFAALDKPVVWLDFLKLRWSYRGPLRFRFEKRMDQTIHAYREVAIHVKKPAHLNALVRETLNNPEKHRQQRLNTTQELIGQVDGLVSKRVCDWLEAKAGKLKLLPGHQ